MVTLAINVITSVERNGVMRMFRGAIALLIATSLVALTAKGPQRVNDELAW